MLCVEFYADSKDDLPPRLAALEQTSAPTRIHYHHATDLAQQARVWRFVKPRWASR